MPVIVASRAKHSRPCAWATGAGDRDQDESRHDERDASQHAVGAYVAVSELRGDEAEAEQRLRRSREAEAQRPR